ncbi:hypothetical protein OH77DRAFT_1519735 [Trametes cingulata]|nr:hypothetical protein OH77DRAFT_1519735 [Trametes cingulata]
MKLTIALLTAAALLARGAFAQSGCTITTPVLHEPDGAVIEGPFIVDSIQFVWTPRVPGGTSVLFQLTDGAGHVADSGVITVRPGPSDCVNPPQ